MLTLNRVVALLIPALLASLAVADTGIPEDALVAGRDGLTRPQTILSPPPVYPLGAQQAQIGGTVELMVLLDVTGKVRQVDVIRCDNPGQGFEASAETAVRRWRWTPILRKGRAVEAYAPVTVAFTPEAAANDSRWRERQSGLRKYAEDKLYPQAPHIAGEAGVSWPVVKKKRSPVTNYYPTAARKRQVESRVLLLVEVAADGTTGAVHLANAERHGQGFEDAATEAVKRWLFEPAVLDGEAVPAWMWIEVEFSMAPGSR